MICLLVLLVLNGHVTLDGLMFENCFLSPFVDGIVRDFASVRDNPTRHSSFN